MNGEDKKKEIDLALLSKSLDSSIGNLQGLLGIQKPQEDQAAEELAKAKKGSSESNDEEDDEEDYEEEEDEDMEKSLSDFVAEDDEEAEMAMDVSPFLKSLTNGIERFISLRFDKLQKSVKAVEQLSKAQGSVMLDVATLQKAVSGMVEVIGNTPIASTSVLQKGGARFPAVVNNSKQYDRKKVLAKSFDLLKEHKINAIQATVIEGRINSRSPLPADVENLFEDCVTQQQ